MEDIKMVSYGFNTMNMLNTNTIGFGNMRMFIGGLNMFGNMVGSSIFTNCNGSFNYDAYAGFQVGSVLMNIGGAILGQVIQEKSANSNKTLTANVEDLNGRISAVEEEKREYDGKVKELEGKNEEAEGNINTYESELSSLKVLETKAADAKNQAFTNLQNATADNKTELQAAYDAAVKAYNEAVKNKENKEKEIEAQQEIIDTNNLKIEELKAKIESCDEELADLKAERDAIQAQLAEQTLDKADGVKLTRTTTEEFAKLYDIENNDYKAGFDASNVSKSDLRYIISQYRTSENAETKEKWAKVMKKIYNDTNLDSSVKSDNIRAAYKLMCE